MAKVKFTAGRIDSFECPDDKGQAFLWDAEVQGLAVRATKGSTRKRYIYETKIKGKTARMTIGEVSAWGIEEAKTEACRLQVVIDLGYDPRQLKIDEAAAAGDAIRAKKAEEAAAQSQIIKEATTVDEAWKAYIAERSAAMTPEGKPEWGVAHKRHHANFVHPGGKPITQGRRPSGPDTTKPGMLLPIMSMRLADLDAKVVAAWLDKDVPLRPTLTAQAFRALRAFMTWCSKNDLYKSVTDKDACEADWVRKKVPKPKSKPNDCLRKAQIKPWFEAVRKVSNPIISAYLQCVLLTGPRRNELATLLWEDVDFQWKSLTIRDKIEGVRTIPRTPYVEFLLLDLKRRNETPPVVSIDGYICPSRKKKIAARVAKWEPSPWVFSSTISESGCLKGPTKAHDKACAAAGLSVSLHGLRRSFATLSEWVEVPAGIVAQIMGHKPSAIAEKHYIQRELDLLHLWHVKIEKWILEQAGIEVPAQPGLSIVKTA